MNITYVHLNSDCFNSKFLKKSNFTYTNVPNYFYNSFKILRKNYNGEVNCIQPKNTINILKKNIDNTNVNFIDAEQYLNNADVKEILKEAEMNFPTHYFDSFWLTTFTRLLILFSFIKDENKTNTFHLEHDNIIFYDPQTIIKYFDNLSQEIFYPKVGPNMSSAGIFFVKSPNSKDIYFNLISKLLKKGEIKVREFAGIYSNLSEMILLSIIQEYEKSKIGELPILPFNNNKFNCIFDGASWGQYAFGTNNGHEAGYAEHNHYVGDSILNNKIHFKFLNKKPVAISIDNGETRIFNLHVHNKKVFDQII